MWLINALLIVLVLLQRDSLDYYYSLLPIELCNELRKELRLFFSKERKDLVDPFIG